MTRPLPSHNAGCGGKLPLPQVIWKDENNHTVSQRCVNGNIEYRWCPVCRMIVKVEVRQK